MSLIDPMQRSGESGWHTPSRRQPDRRFDGDSQSFELREPAPPAMRLSVMFYPLTALPSLLEAETPAVPDATPAGLRVSFYSEHLAPRVEQPDAGTRLDALA